MGMSHNAQVEDYCLTICSVLGVFWKCARIGERLSPYISICCLIMAVSHSCNPPWPKLTPDRALFSLATKATTIKNTGVWEFTWEIYHYSAVSMSDFDENSIMS
mgnify:CR=1 FL=1